MYTVLLLQYRTEYQNSDKQAHVHLYFQPISIRKVVRYHYFIRNNVATDDALNNGSLLLDM